MKNNSFISSFMCLVDQRQTLLCPDQHETWYKLLILSVDKQMYAYDDVYI